MQKLQSRQMQAAWQATPAGSAPSIGSPSPSPEELHSSSTLHRKGRLLKIRRANTKHVLQSVQALLEQAPVSSVKVWRGAALPFASYLHSPHARQK
jgi:hypothetical protein